MLQLYSLELLRSQPYGLQLQVFLSRHPTKVFNYIPLPQFNLQNIVSERYIYNSQSYWVEKRITNHTISFITPVLVCASFKQVQNQYLQALVQQMRLCDQQFFSLPNKTKSYRYNVRKQYSASQIMAMEYSQKPWWGDVKGKPVVIAHRAGCGEAPENTIAALRHSLRQGASIVQVEVVKTKDGTPIIAQSDNLYRLTGENKNISELTIDEIPPLADKIPPYMDICVEIDTTDQDEDGKKIPSLRSFLKAFAEEDKDKKAALFVEPFKLDKELIARIAQDINEVGIGSRVIVGHPFDDKIQDLCIQAFPDAEILLTFPQIVRLGVMYFFGLLSSDKVPRNRVINCFFKIKRKAEMTNKLPFMVKLFLSFMIFLLSLFVYRKSFAEFVQQNGCPISFFVLNDEEDWVAAQQLGARAVLTDFPKQCQEFIKKSDW
eukprot:TRINITY_DN2093_c0_g1_i2.p1 TRINITY_DN2093_c0_g1~~TRINITY_DN2093_c0_g1_i2.p1  ORF type:complete len:433 (+),score=21.81 TRINITY_DN2093_c0_g1_i2:1298-2596(+)